MNYELAKKLKDSGFPFQIIQDCIIRDCSGPGCEEKVIHFGETVLYSIPTLSQLIEACGEEFRCMERFSDGIFSCGDYRGCYDGNVDFERISEGKTPEEAVANLFLELKKSQTK